jgi:hypothetical protein
MASDELQLKPGPSMGHMLMAENGPVIDSAMKT